MSYAILNPVTEMSVYVIIFVFITSNGVTMKPAKEPARLPETANWTLPKVTCSSGIFVVFDLYFIPYSFNYSKSGNCMLPKGISRKTRAGYPFKKPLIPFLYSISFTASILVSNFPIYKFYLTTSNGFLISAAEHSAMAAASTFCWLKLSIF